MKLTCLSKGRGFYYPPCHILDLYGCQVLLDCPLDLSGLTVFSPIPSDSSDMLDEEPLKAQNIIYSEPYYKTVKGLHTWDFTSIDVVLISSPMGMIGLPFLTRTADFSAKIYVTEAAARLGQLMMEELVTMQMEHRQFYGPEEDSCPQWTNQEELDLLSSTLKNRVFGEDGSDIASWMYLYSAADVKDCMLKIQTLKYAEETCYNGVLTLKALSSGLEIGACNWTINSPKQSIACISSSIFTSFHAMNFDFKGLQGYDLVLYSDFSYDPTEEIDIGNICTDDTSGSDDLINALLLNDEENMEEMEKISFMTCAVIDSVKLGGSVLIPIGRLGIILQLLETISSSLESSNLKVPIYFISSVAEELLAFSNIIPEWLCKERQERMYSGQSLFAHVDLIAQNKLHLFTDVYSDKLLKMWEEPCIVFCSHWSLRLGPVVHLLRRWSGDPHSLLVIEGGVDADLALLPFKPMAMKILQCSFLSGMRLQKVQPLLRYLQPKFVLVPEDLAHHFDFSNTHSTKFIHYSENITSNVANFEHICPELSIEADLVCHHLDWIELKQEQMQIAKLKGELFMENSKHILCCGNEKQPDSIQTRHYSLQWGSINSQNLVEMLEKMGINACLEQGMLDSDSNHATIHILKPNNGFIKMEGTRTVISVGDEKLASLVLEAVCNCLNGF